MPHFSRFTHSIAVFAVLALLLSGFSPLRAEASAASTRTKGSASVKAGSAAKQKKTAANAERQRGPTRASAGKAKKPTAAASARNPRKTASGKAGAVKPAPASTSGKKAGSKSRRAARNASAPRGPYKSAVLYNTSTGQVIFSRNPNTQVPPASLTKILSMYVAEDAIRARKINPDALVTVSPRAAAAGGSRMGLRAYDKVPLGDLLHGMAVSSGNDASIAVAEFIGGSERKFVQMMNQKARSLGMTRSTFVNANGLPAPGQYTTARDMLLLARAYLAAYPGNLQKHHNQIFNSYKGNMTANANPLLRSFHGADGLKTGFVSAAGYNLIATAKRDGQRVIGVVLGAPSSAVRATESCSLMEACFRNPATLTAQSSPGDLAAAGGRTPTASKKGKSETLIASDQGKAKSAGGKKARSKSGSSATKGKKATGTAVKSTADSTPKTRKRS